MLLQTQLVIRTRRVFCPKSMTANNTEYQMSYLSEYYRKADAAEGHAINVAWGWSQEKPAASQNAV